MQTRVLTGAFIHWKLILLIQAFSLGIIPAIGLGLSKLLYMTTFDKRLTNGIVIACCTPTTIASNVYKLLNDERY